MPPKDYKELRQDLGQYLLDLIHDGYEISIYRLIKVSDDIRIRVHKGGHSNFKIIRQKEFEESYLHADDILKLYIEQMVKEF